jgi:glucosamine-phosphate N-acetyltransferase
MSAVRYETQLREAEYYKRCMDHSEIKLEGRNGWPSKNDSDSIIIRELCLEDLDYGFLESLDNLIAGTSDLAKEKARGLLQEIKSNTLHKIFVAILHSELKPPVVVGTTTLLVEPKFIFKGGRVGHIEDVSVRKGYEKMGIGRRLVMNATAVAKEMGCLKVVLDCSDETMPFYEKLGYSYQDNCMKKFLKD